MKTPKNHTLHILRCGSFVRVRLLPDHFQYGRIGSKVTPEHSRDTFYLGIILRRCKTRTIGVSSSHILVISGPMKGHSIIVDYADKDWRRAIMLPALGLKKAEKFFKAQFGFREINLMDGFSYLVVHEETQTLIHADIIHYANQAIRTCATPIKK